MTLSKETIALIEQKFKDYTEPALKNIPNALFDKDDFINGAKLCLTDPAILASVKGEEPTPSSTVDLEREAREYYFKKTGNVIAENSRPDLVIGYVDGSKATSQKGLDEFISEIDKVIVMWKDPSNAMDGLHVLQTLQAKATELLTKK